MTKPDLSYWDSMVPESVEPPAPETRLFAIEGCGRHRKCCTDSGIHIGYQSNWGPASLCGNGNDSLGWYRHHIWTEVEGTEVTCRACFEKGKELSGA